MTSDMGNVFSGRRGFLARHPNVWNEHPQGRATFFCDWRIRTYSEFIEGSVVSQQAEVDKLMRLQAETAAELDALLPAILDRAFKGEL